MLYTVKSKLFKEKFTVLDYKSKVQKLNLSSLSFCSFKKSRKWQGEIEEIKRRKWRNKITRVCILFESSMKLITESLNFTVYQILTVKGNLY